MKKKSIPTIFGQPAWFGKIKARVALRYLHRRYRIGFFLKKEIFTRICNIQVGDIINDCTGSNGKILKIEPIYYKVAKGYVLYDIDIETSNTCCSLINCGVEPPLSRDQIENNFIHFMDNWFFGEGGKKWYGGLDNPKFEKEVKFKIAKYNVIKRGGHIVDEQGLALSEETFFV